MVCIRVCSNCICSLKFQTVILMKVSLLFDNLHQCINYVVLKNTRLILSEALCSIIANQLWDLELFYNYVSIYYVICLRTIYNWFKSFYFWERILRLTQNILSFVTSISQRKLMDILSLNILLFLVSCHVSNEKK